MSEDLISRQAAIKAICEDGTWLESQGCTEITMAERKQRDADILSDLPSAQQWIPVTERLPERGVSVLISHVGYVTEDYLDIDDGAMYFWNSGIDLEEELKNLAWMPLPEPWKGGAA